MYTYLVFFAAYLALAYAGMLENEKNKLMIFKSNKF
jgi:hypothetical protein